MSATNDFLDGSAALLVTAGAGVYRPNGPAYTGAEVGISTDGTKDSPDSMIVLTSYLPGGDDPNLPMGRLGLQALTRAATSRGERTIRDLVYATFHGLKRTPMGSITVVQMQIISSTPMGKDAANRPTFALHFYANVDYPATANRNLTF